MSVKVVLANESDPMPFGWRVTKSGLDVSVEIGDEFEFDPVLFGEAEEGQIIQVAIANLMVTCRLLGLTETEAQDTMMFVLGQTGNDPDED